MFFKRECQGGLWGWGNMPKWRCGGHMDLHFARRNGGITIKDLRFLGCGFSLGAN